MTADNQAARVFVGQNFPYITASSTIVGTTAVPTIVNSIGYQEVGVQLQVTPKINPDGSVVMRVVPTVSDVASTTVQITTGTFATAFNVQTVETTVIAQDGETVVLGGLIKRANDKIDTKIPWFGDLPGVGALFRYRQQQKKKTELLIIMTPHIVRDRAELDRILAEESNRMNWILPDVLRTYGTHGMEPVMPDYEPPPPGYLKPPCVPGSPYSLFPPPPPPPGAIMPMYPGTAATPGAKTPEVLPNPTPGTTPEPLPNPTPVPNKGTPIVPSAPNLSQPVLPGQPVIHQSVPVLQKNPGAAARPLPQGAPGAAGPQAPAGQPLPTVPLQGPAAIPMGMAVPTPGQPNGFPPVQAGPPQGQPGAGYNPAAPETLPLGSYYNNPTPMGPPPAAGYYNPATQAGNSYPQAPAQPYAPAGQGVMPAAGSYNPVSQTGGSYPQAPVQPYAPAGQGMVPAGGYPVNTGLIPTQQGRESQQWQYMQKAF
jgi:hypothetical protein